MVKEEDQVYEIMENGHQQEQVGSVSPLKVGDHAWNKKDEVVNTTFTIESIVLKDGLVVLNFLDGCYDVSFITVCIVHRR